jgi:hypothetical protein
MRKNVLKYLAVMALGAVLLLPNLASATISFLSNYGGYENWPPTISTPYSGNIDHMEVYITGGSATFDSPYLADTGDNSFNSGGWTATSISPTHVAATTATVGGVAVVNWNDYFSGSTTILPLTVETNYFLGGVFKAHEYLNFPATGGFVNYYDSIPVPIPPTVLLLGTGLLGLKGLRRKYKS